MGMRGPRDKRTRLKFEVVLFRARYSGRPRVSLETAKSIETHQNVPDRENN